MGNIIVKYTKDFIVNSDFKKIISRIKFPDNQSVCNVEIGDVFRRKHILFRIFACIAVAFLFPQFSLRLQGQKIAEKTNLAAWASLSPNIGTEVALSRKWSMDVSLSYHPWKVSETFSLRHWLVSPELRYWFCKTYAGSFVGLHAVGGQFNIRALPLTGISKNYEYAGWLAGGGLDYGYQLPLSARWGLEFTAGLGYAWISYDKYECKECREKVAQGYYSYFGPTRFRISLIYFLQ